MLFSGLEEDSLDIPPPSLADLAAKALRSCIAIRDTIWRQIPRTQRSAGIDPGVVPRAPKFPVFSNRLGCFQNPGVDVGPQELARPRLPATKRTLQGCLFSHRP